MCLLFYYLYVVVWTYEDAEVLHCLDSRLLGFSYLMNKWNELIWNDVTITIQKYIV